MTALARLGEFFAVEQTVTGEGWHPLAELLDGPFPDHRVVAAHLVLRSRSNAEVEPRVAASIASLGLFARLLSPTIGALLLDVDAPADLRLIRRIRRDEAERGRSAESVIQQYLRFVRPAQTRFIDPARHYCDIVIACEAAPPNRLAPPDSDSVDRLLAPVWVQLQKLGVAG